MSDTEKAALVLAFDEIAKSRQRMEVFIDVVNTVQQHANAVPALQQRVVEAETKTRQIVEVQTKFKRQIVLAKGKSHIDAQGHLILVYTDGSQEDVGEVRIAPIIRHSGGGGSGITEDKVRELIATSANMNPLTGYRIADEDSDGTVRYYGYQNPDGAWYIMRVDDTTSIAQYRYANGASDYNAAWAGRAWLVYDLLSELTL